MLASSGHGLLPNSAPQLAHFDEKERLISLSVSMERDTASARKVAAALYVDNLDEVRHSLLHEPISRSACSFAYTRVFGLSALTPTPSSSCSTSRPR